LEVNNPFAAYGIEHLSPSSCNTFSASAAAFVMQKCFKIHVPVGAAAFRGSAVEDGIIHGLLNEATVDECLQVTTNTFNRLSALTLDPKKDKEEGSLHDMVRMGLAELKDYGKPSSVQGRVEYRVEGLAVPLIGFYDAEWEQHGVLTDIKTSHALPSKIKTAHARQVALYRAARGHNMSARVTYITPKKSATYELENADQHLQALVRIAMSIQNFLADSPDPHVLASKIAVDTDSFYFNDPIARQKAFEIWGY
jgi:hypothetical protein